MRKIAVFPGSFDPITLGHESIILRGAPLFDEIVVAIGTNSNKKYFFDLEQRKNFIEETFANVSNVRVSTYEGLTVDYCESIDATYILRGLRNTIDFEYEKSIAQMNRSLKPNIETIFMFSDPEHSAINSTIVRDILRHGGNVDAYLPQAIKL
jgi:pantetheine-phosphate adenylyltransferase